jgi:tetratricopeptide (TPR) repeat protein
VSKKHKQKRQATLVSSSVLRDRVEKALGEERFQHALELARSLARQDPTEASREIMRRACLGRARQLRGQGHHRDACSVLNSAVELDGSPTFRAEVAQELAACGDVRGALDLARALAEPQLEAKVFARAADSAVVQGAAGRDLLPEGLRGQLDLVVRAFAQVEAGQDEAARETLQGLGLQSPFLEWKLLLRGLIAYYQNDDTRAVENWQRLGADRWPARLAAPFRFLIDKAFRAAQPPATQAVLQKQADRLQGSGLVPALRGIQAALSNEKQLPQAFRQAEGLIETLRREAPGHVPRLAACFFWAIIHHGNPEDLQRYRRVFGGPADDPDLNRLQALALEHRGMMQPAHEAWQDVEKGIAANPTAWPGEQAGRARALIWAHMGRNAEDVPNLDDLPGLPPFLRDHPDRPRPLKPPAEECFRKSLELAPDQLEGHLALLRHYQKKNQPVKAEKAARRLLKQFPDHVPTLETLGDLCLHEQKYAEAALAFAEAAKLNPLERRLRHKLSAAHTFAARSHAEAGRFDEARAGYQAALALEPDRDNYAVLCKWAACEFKAKEEARGEELLQQALSAKGSQLAVYFSMLIEAIRLKLPRPLKTRFDKEVNGLLAEPPTVEAAVALSDTVAAHRRAGVTYFGQKTHEKKVLTYLEKARGLPFTEDQLTTVCGALHELDKVRLQRNYLHLGQQRFPNSPIFYLGEAELNLERELYYTPLLETQRLLKQARELATVLPAGERRQFLLDRIQELENEARSANPFANMFGQMPFDPFDDGDEFDDGPDEFDY